MALNAIMPSVAKASAAPTAEGENQQLKAGVYYIVNDKRQAGTDLHVYVDENGLHGKNYTSPAADFANVFVLHAKGDKYTIQSLKDGKYVQNVTANSVPYKTGNDAHKFQIVYQTQSSGTGKSYL